MGFNFITKYQNLDISKSGKVEESVKLTILKICVQILELIKNYCTEKERINTANQHMLHFCAKSVVLDGRMDRWLGGWMGGW